MIERLLHDLIGAALTQSYYQKDVVESDLTRSLRESTSRDRREKQERIIFLVNELLDAAEQHLSCSAIRETGKCGQCEMRLRIAIENLKNEKG